MMSAVASAAAPEAPWFFPVTPFDDDGALHLALLRSHIASRLEHRPEAIVAAGGAGEFSALDADEVLALTRTAVEAAGGIPVYTGTGGPLGHALRIAREAGSCGAQGLLLLPPYLIPPAGDDGLVAYAEAVLSATELPVLLYHRGSASLTPEAVRRLVRHERIIGIKDGVGDLAVMERLRAAAQAEGRELLYFNGMPTAELHQADYDRIGITRYSSALFTMAPEIAIAFQRSGQALRERLRSEFLMPLAALRDAMPGYAVSLIKAGLRLQGVSIGSVRPPLIDPPPQHLARLEALLNHGTALVAGDSA